MPTSAGINIKELLPHDIFYVVRIEESLFLLLTNF